MMQFSIHFVCACMFFPYPFPTWPAVLYILYMHVCFLHTWIFYRAPHQIMPYLSSNLPIPLIMCVWRIPHTDQFFTPSHLTKNHPYYPYENFMGLSSVTLNVTTLMEQGWYHMGKKSWAEVCFCQFVYIIFLKLPTLDIYSRTISWKMTVIFLILV